MKSLAHLSTRIFDTPIAIHQGKLETILAVVGDRFGLEVTAEQLEAAKAFKPPSAKDYSVQDGIAVIEITGSLVNKASGLMVPSGLSSYETVAAQFKDAIQNPAIKGILLSIDSPGGEVSGLFELADLIYGGRQSKPIYAVADDSAFSAAYALASSADKIYVTRTGGVGSVGIVLCHIDQSKADEKQGLKYEFIFAGDRKVDGNPHEPLSEQARADLQTEIDRVYGMFTSLVARNRSKNLQAIVDTQAGCFFGENAIPLLADKVGTAEDALNDLAALINISAQAMPVTKQQVKRAGGPSLNTNSQADRVGTNCLATKADDEETEFMAKTKELSIDELVAKAAIEASDEEEMEKECEAASDEEDTDEEDDDEDDKKKDTEAKATRIVTMCQLAGVPQLAATFIANKYTESQVSAALLKQRTGKSKKLKTSSDPTTDPASMLRAGFEQIMSDDKPNKGQRYAQFISQHQREYAAYTKSRKGAERE